MKTLSITILSVAALAGLASVATASAAEARDVLTPVAKDDVRVLGRPGELMQASLNSRVFSEYAQGPVYDEAENAFVLTLHGIHPDAKHIHMKTEWLERILSTAKECGVPCLGFDEL